MDVYKGQEISRKTEGKYQDGVQVALLVANLGPPFGTTLPWKERICSKLYSNRQFPSRNLLTHGSINGLSGRTEKTQRPWHTGIIQKKDIKKITDSDSPDTVEPFGEKKRILHIHTYHNIFTIILAVSSELVLVRLIITTSVIGANWGKPPRIGKTRW